MPNHLHRYNHIDDALCSRIINSIFNKELSYAHISKCCDYPYENIKSITKAFEENHQFVSKYRR